jgi:hypothetical protein
MPAVTTYAGDTGRTRGEAEILQDIRRLLPGDIAYGHVHAIHAAVDLLCQPGYAVFFMLRDPRDVVVSHVHYVTEMEPGHILHRYYADELSSFDQRLMTSILGIPEQAIEFPNIAQRFAPFLGWLERPEVLALRFEAFAQDRASAIGAAVDHAVERGFPLQCPRQKAVQTLIDRLDPVRSPTFRKGKVGGWREVFSPEHKRVFKETAGEMLIQLGYEQGFNW